jgi:mannan endo-1,4-beta-mannosidase
MPTLQSCVLVLWGFLALVALSATGRTQTLLGVYYGNQGWKMEQVQAIESWQGKKNAVVNLFTDWTNTNKVMTNLFGQQLPNIWSNGNVPMVTWEPFAAAQTPANVEVRIAAGQYDAHVTNWAGRLKTFLSGPDGVFGTADDRRVYLRLGHEMNGNWYPWSAAVGGNTPADYVAMWRHVVTIFDGLNLDANHLQWVWCVNAEDVGGFQAADFYPGDAYVDWVAIDGYNWGASQTWSSWKTPAQVFDAMLIRIRALTARPLALTEFASTSSTTTGTSLAAKSAWITDVFAYAAQNQIRMVCWFNDDKETDWAIFGGANGDGQFKFARTTYRTYSAYRTAVSGATLTGPNPANPRLLLDSQFAGN